jgi:hypothetical protein
MANIDGEDARDIAVKRLQAKRQFTATLVSGLGVIALMVVIWLLSGRGYFWPVWVVFGFAIALATPDHRGRDPARGQPDAVIRRLAPG